MVNEPSSISYHKSWHIEVPGLKALDFASDHHSFATYDQSGTLRLFNQNGQELWHRNAGYELTGISLADTLEVLAIDSEKYSVLYGPEGATLWRKRPFPASIGKISASGEGFSFVTTDPAIIGADRSLRVKWAYRNLMKRPVDLVVSAAAQTTAFPCADDRGEGLAAVNLAGKPYDAFMGIENIMALDVSQDGQIAVALAAHGKVFCLNVQKGCGIWKGALGGNFDGISYAARTSETAVFSASGRVILLDASGNQIWEHYFADRLMKISLTADGTGIFYATERGEIGLLTHGAGQVNNSVVFQEVAVKPVPVALQSAFKKVWNIELAGTSEHQSSAYPWKGQDGVEYCLIWDGVENLSCINDLGEEVWQTRMNASEVLDLSASSEADLAVVVTRNGVVGFDLSGFEVFKFFGQFKQVHVFAEGAILLLDIQGRCRFYQSSDHFSHCIEIEGQVRQILGLEGQALLRSDNGLTIVDNDGQIVVQHENDAPITFSGFSHDLLAIVAGDEIGKVMILDLQLKETFAYTLKGPIRLLEYNRELETIFVGTDSEKLQILRRRTGEMMTTSLVGRPAYVTYHEAGAVIGTDLDQLGLINADGQILARYTSPYKLKKLFPCHRRMSLIALADEALGCIAAILSSQQP